MIELYYQYWIPRKGNSKDSACLSIQHTESIPQHSVSGRIMVSIAILEFTNIGILSEGVERGIQTRLAWSLGRIS